MYLCIKFILHTQLCTNLDTFCFFSNPLLSSSFKNHPKPGSSKNFSNAFKQTRQLFTSFRCLGFQSFQAPHNVVAAEILVVLRGTRSRRPRRRDTNPVAVVPGIVQGNVHLPKKRVSGMIYMLMVGTTKQQKVTFKQTPFLA